MKRIIKVICTILALSLMLIACSNKENNPDIALDGKKQVYASVFPIYSLAKEIAGENVDLHCLVPSGGEPHDWEPSPKDMAKLEDCDLLIISGAGMEPWLEAVKASLGDKMPAICDTSEGIELIEFHEDGEDNDQEHHHGAYDPHLWLNPENAKLQMQNISNALRTLDSVDAETILKNYQDSEKKIDALDQQYQNAKAQWMRNDIVVMHEAFGYLCQAYGLEQIPLEGINADAEPSPAKMAELSKYIQDHDVKAIFAEPLLSDKTAQTLVNETGVLLLVLDPFEGMTQENIDAGMNYYSVMESNLKNLNIALGAENE